LIPQVKEEIDEADRPDETGYWVALDLLLLSLVTGLVLGIGTIAGGVWAPFGPDMPSLWAGLAFVVWLMVVFTVVPFIGWQIECMKSGRVADTVRQPYPAPAPPPAPADPVRQPREGERPVPAPQSALQETAAPESDRVLIPAGR
jgi:hypothetical protein